MSQHMFRGQVPILTTNPATFMLNDICFGFANMDIVKDMCINMCFKNPPPKEGEAKPLGKIELALQSIL